MQQAEMNPISFPKFEKLLTLGEKQTHTYKHNTRIKKQKASNLSLLRRKD